MSLNHQVSYLARSQGVKETENCTEIEGQLFGIRTVRYTDNSLRTVRYGQFATGQFATWTDRYMDSSLHGQFATDSLLRTVRYMEILLQVQVQSVYT